jgi:SET domain-containing protein
MNVATIDLGMSDLIFKNSPIHGSGGFANRDLPKGARLIEYVGEKINKAESLRRCEQENWRIFSLDEEWDLDGDFDWNPARLLNHSCAPNCDAELIEGRIWIVAQREIKAGDEITFNYGYDLDSYEDHPCRCGSSECVGYIVAEEFFPHVRKNTLTRGEHR